MMRCIPLIKELFPVTIVSAIILFSCKCIVYAIVPFFLAPIAVFLCWLIKDEDCKRSIVSLFRLGTSILIYTFTGSLLYTLYYAACTMWNGLFLDIILSNYKLNATRYEILSYNIITLFCVCAIIPAILSGLSPSYWLPEIALCIVSLLVYNGMIRLDFLGEVDSSKEEISTNSQVYSSSSYLPSCGYTDGGVYLFGNYDVAVFQEVAEGSPLCGDFVAWRRITDGGTMFIIGDVVDHGVAAGAVAHTIIGAFMGNPSAETPESVIYHLDSIVKHMRPHSDEIELFSTCVCMKVEPNGDFALVNAGERVSIVKIQEGKGDTSSIITGTDHIPVGTALIGTIRDENIVLRNGTLKPKEMVMINTDGWRNRNIVDDRTCVLLTYDPREDDEETYEVVGSSADLPHFRI